MESNTTPLIDALGRRVPDRLVGQFKHRDSIDERIKHVEQFKDALLIWCKDAKYGIFKDLPVERVRNLLTEAIHQVRHHMPKVPCICGPSDDCKICDGKRWVSNYDIYRASANRKKNRLLAALEADYTKIQPCQQNQEVAASSVSP